jgi:hypothetical protein
MTEEEKLKEIWNQKQIPVIFRASKKVDLSIRLPYNVGNRGWLKCSKRKTEPDWNTEKKYWVLPRSRLNELVEMILKRFGKLYIIQPYRNLEICAPACWNAMGHECECSCMGENHGRNHHEAGWFVVSEAFAVRHGKVRFGSRLLQVKNPT